MRRCRSTAAPPRHGDNAASRTFRICLLAEPREIFIQGTTRDGRTFRPSDWAERLAGVMSQFRPGGAQPGSHLSYSPWCIPTVINGVKCVVVNSALRNHEPMAWDFVMNFAKDNELQVSEACLIPEERLKPRAA